MRGIHQRWTDQRIEGIISLLLRTGVIGAAVVVLGGGIFYLLQYGAILPHYQVFHGEPSGLRSLSGIVAAALALDSRGIIQLGLLLLILTPVARVAFSVAAFGLQRDRLYVIVTLIVFGILLYNLLHG